MLKFPFPVFCVGVFERRDNILLEEERRFETSLLFNVRVELALTALLLTVELIRD